MVNRKKKYILLLIPIILALSSCSTTSILSCNELKKWDRPEVIFMNDNTRFYTYSNYSNFTVREDTLCVSRTKNSQPIKCIPCNDIRSIVVLQNAKLKPPLIISTAIIGGILILIPW